jgi:hypothetical protein
MGDILFQRWPTTTHRNGRSGASEQLHLDITVDDIDAAERRVLELVRPALPGEGRNWRVYADPASHPFCLLWMV